MDKTNKPQIKEYSCERCGKEITKFMDGKCLACTYLYERKKYIPGLLRMDEYDKNNNFDVNFVKKIIGGGSFRKPIKKKSNPKEKKLNLKERAILLLKDELSGKCPVCFNEFDSNKGKYNVCYTCYKFYNKFGGIRNYKTFLMVFKLEDCLESKENYIKFVEDFNKFVDNYFPEDEQESEITQEGGGENSNSKKKNMNLSDKEKEKRRDRWNKMIKDARKEYPNAWKSWKESDDKELLILYNKEKSIQEITEILGRNPNSITMRLENKHGINLEGSKDQ